MKRKLTPTWRLFALALALMLAGDATGVFAAAALVVPRDECCHAAQSAPACPIATCMAAGCLPRAVDFSDEMLTLKQSPARERWVSADQRGTVRTEEPPVPPPRR